LLKFSLKVAELALACCSGMILDDGVAAAEAGDLRETEAVGGDFRQVDTDKALSKALLEVGGDFNLGSFLAVKYELED
jgi:hypothetical protein